MFQTKSEITRRDVVFLFTSFLVFSFVLVSQETVSAKKVESKYFKRLYQINDSVYRSDQPNRKGFRELEAKGINSVINFRRNVRDDKRARDTKLHLEHFPLKTSELSEEQIVSALKLVQAAEKPVLIHCWHGSDRTGAIAAAYRIVFEGWEKEKAIAELRRDEFGYHENWYPNVVDLLKNLNVGEIRNVLGIKQ
ncbi:MAG: dual specificity protein phosphatase family protein [Bacteroidota bacterium]